MSQHTTRHSRSATLHKRQVALKQWVNRSEENVHISSDITIVKPGLKKQYHRYTLTDIFFITQKPGYIKKIKQITFIQPSKTSVLQERPNFPIRGRCSVLFLNLITTSFTYPFSMDPEKM